MASKGYKNTLAEQRAIRGANSPSATNVFATVDDLDDLGVASVASTVELMLLDALGALDEGTSCLVQDRGDGLDWRYRYVVGAVPDPDYGTIGTVVVYPVGTNGYWSPENLPAFLSILTVSDAKRLGSYDGIIIGDASTWLIETGGPDANGQGFELDYDGAHPEDVVFDDATAALCTTIPNTVLYINLALKDLTGTNARARCVYDYNLGTYCITFPADVDMGPVVITSPAGASTDISTSAKLNISTGLATVIRFSAIDSLSARTVVAERIPAVAQDEAVPFQIVRHLSSGGGTAVSIYDANVPYSFVIVGVKVICTFSSGGGSFTLDSDVGAGYVAVTDAIPCVTAGVVSYAGTMADGQIEISANDGIQVTKQDADKGIIVIDCIRGSIF